MTDTDVRGDGYREPRTLVEQLVAVASAPLAMALGSLLFGMASLRSLTPADDIGDLDTSNALGVGVALPGAHSHQISVGIRFAVSLLALLLATAAVRRLFRSRGNTGQVESAQWREMVAGAAVLVAVLAVALNAVAFAGALGKTSSIYSVYNHIGS